MRLNVDAALAARLAGRRVALVGSAGSLVGRGLGRWIDGHDVVVRANLAVPLVAELAPDIGTRCAVLYHLLRPDLARLAVGDHEFAATVDGWWAAGVRHVVSKRWPSHPLVRRARRLLATVPLERRPRLVSLADGEYQRLKRRVGVPNMITVAVVHLLAAPLERLSLTGVDWFASGYYPGYGALPAERAAAADGAADWGDVSQASGARPSHPHDQRRQMRLVAELAASDKRLVLDEVARARVAGS